MLGLSGSGLVRSTRVEHGSDRILLSTWAIDITFKEGAHPLGAYSMRLNTVLLVDPLT